MKSFFDRIIRAGKSNYPSDLGWIYDALPLAQQFEITNVASYYFVGTDQDDWRLSRDLPNQAPPYPVMWFEYPGPDLIRSVSQGEIVDMDYAGRIGVAIVSTDLSKGERLPIQVSIIPTGTHWVSLISASLWITRKNGAAADYCETYPLIAILFIDEMGKAIVKTSAEGDLVSYGWSSTANPDAAETRPFWGQVVPALLSVSLLHCKNTVVETHEPAAEKPRRDRRHTHQRNTFHTLRVVPMKTITRRQPAESSGDEAGSRFHHKRGHFKTYGDDAPLFGRWSGTWWWSDQTAGDIALGSIEKVYDVVWTYEQSNN